MPRTLADVEHYEEYGEWPGDNGGNGDGRGGGGGRGEPKWWEVGGRRPGVSSFPYKAGLDVPYTGRPTGHMPTLQESLAGWLSNLGSFGQTRMAWRGDVPSSWSLPSTSPYPEGMGRGGETETPSAGGAQPRDIWSELGLTPPMDYQQAAQLMYSYGNPENYEIRENPATGGYGVFAKQEWAAGGGGGERYGAGMGSQEYGLRKQELRLAEQQMKMEMQQRQQQMEMQQQQYLAQLAANPMSWLEYAAAAGTTPAIQPWMLPLMSQEYSQLQAGQAIPGYGGTAGMTEMPELMNPSAQYLSRMGPTAQAQYYGYQHAQQAALPAETEFRQWSASAPGGANRGLSYRR